MDNHVEDEEGGGEEEEAGDSEEEEDDQEAEGSISIDDDNDPPPSYNQLTPPPPPPQPPPAHHPSKHGPERSLSYTSSAALEESIPRICICLLPLMVLIIIVALGVIGFLMVLSMIITSEHKVNHEVLRLSEYMPSSCTVVFVGLREADLEWRACPGKSYQYYCWQIKVNFRAGTNLLKGKVLRDTIDTLEASSSCSVRPVCHPDEDRRLDVINSFLADYGIEGATFDCYYNDLLIPVVKKPWDPSVFMVPAFVIPSFFLLLCFLGINILCYLSGGPREIWQKYRLQYHVRQLTHQRMVMAQNGINHQEAGALEKEENGYYGYGYPEQDGSGIIEESSEPEGSQGQEQQPVPQEQQQSSDTEEGEEPSSPPPSPPPPPPPPSSPPPSPSSSSSTPPPLPPPPPPEQIKDSDDVADDTLVKVVTDS